MEALSLYDLNALVRRSLEQCLPDEYWVQAELSDVRTNSTGHCYLEFIQKDPRSNNLIAKARGTIWANVYRLLKPYFEESTGQAFVSGIKVLVQVTVSFHELYGYSLTVQDIDPTYTLGDMARRRREILKQLEEEGVLTLNKELEMPVLPQRIAVVSSPTAAGYGDFCHQLKNNSRGFFFHTELFPALMQGDRVEESVLSALDAILNRQEDFDAVVIIRGGGATSDLSGFDTYLLAAACAQFPLPIITGIGHERDDTVLDSVAHTRVKTPTAAAEYLINCMDLAADELEVLISQLHESVRSRLTEEHRKLISYRNRIPSAVVRRVSDAKLALLTTRKDISLAVQTLLSRQRHRLELLQQRLADASPEKMLARGYSITLKDGKVVKDAALLNEEDEIITRFYRGEVTSVISRKS
ncbi:exodeoxyribonuclease VII large subunit [Bacteroides intestinalis]|jgi:exodeoxyribonuclease VII large subunit|uniref:Exodeoxyribonuclease 7 large subunit n=1 Tax=Bacteroides intestinalis TaxID=329854 RepID=A0AAQ0LK24_9BACE|nr:exodeoxyribonuclease VII large subunit [Bacteroides intestinalis]QDO71479.1 exodeoxyribonuclease VII large subunit [Bacteroides intestinalis]RGT47354.1 exodeoxyribonuclease VII large subunit [Bacteroides intestinalis]UCB37570.1 exodeoxyribonuclease VII large subunit [Bacteroides intestinalis]UCB41814.1 exodeoxyribonuclease VII large subunit [Bacteroides intestinalis]